MKSIFEYSDYKLYLCDYMDARAKRGERNRLANAVGCHNGYVSQVLKGQAHFSLEQAELITGFLGHTKTQAHFFLLLVQLNRAGTPALRNYFRDQLQLLQEAQLNLKNRLQFQRALAPEDQSTFYSSWHYGAIHVLVSVPGCETEQGICEYLGLPLERVREILGFLASIGLIKEDRGRFEVGQNQIHLASDSPMIAKHHTNWRMRMIQALDVKKPEHLHYSSVITASGEDSLKVREILVQAIERVRAVVRTSPNENGFAYSVDFFGLKRF